MATHHANDTQARWRALVLCDALDRALQAIGWDKEARIVYAAVLTTQLNRVVTGECTPDDARQAIKTMLLDG